MIPRTRFGAQVPTPRRREQEIPVEVRGGLHAGVPPQDLQAGFVPSVQNFVPRIDGFVTPRSGLSKPETYDFKGPVLGAFEVYDLLGGVGVLATSQTSASFLHPTNAVWSDLSYTQSNLTHVRGNLSGVTSDYFRAASIFEPLGERIITVFSNNTDSFKFFEVDASSTTFSDFSWPDSFESTKASKDVVSINDRLVFFNVLSSDGTRYPTRVMWSARGNPTSFVIAEGAGAEDLMDMKGEGQAAIRFREYLILFTEFEIWRAVPTLDAYAFRFDRVVENIGTLWPRSAAVTPMGVIFLGRDYELYLTDGAGIQALGPFQGSGPSRIANLLRERIINPDRMFGVYNQSEDRYELYFPTTGSEDGFAGEAVFYSVPDQTFWTQKFAFGLSAGVDATDPTTVVTWDELTQTFDSGMLGWDDFGAASGQRRVNVFDSKGSNLRFRSDQTTDSGTAIDARIRSPAATSGTKRMNLKEVWIDYDAPSASSASLWMGSSASTGFTDPTAVSLTTSGSPTFVPVWNGGPRPAFELRLNDGGTPRIASFQIKVQEGSRF